MNSSGDENLLHIAAESNYRLYLNGVMVGRGPARGTKALNFFDSYEVSGLLRMGENWVAAEVHSPNVPTFKAAPAQPGVLIQLGEGELVRSDESWEAQRDLGWRSDVRSFTFQIGFLEWKDFRQEPADWMVGGDDSTGWSPAETVSRSVKISGKELLPRDIPALEETRCRPSVATAISAVPCLEDPNDGEIAKLIQEETHRPVADAPDLMALISGGFEAIELHPPSDESGLVFLIGFDCEINGAFEIDVEAPSGTILDLAYDEEFYSGRLPALINAYAFADRYILKEGRQNAGNIFAERGFRVVQVIFRNFSKPITIHKITGVSRLYPFVEQATFHCSDPTLNQVWNACIQTMRSCATDTFVDCPWRENALYLNDLLVENVVALQLFGDPRLAARCFRLAASQTRPDGLIPAAIPCGVLPGHTDGETEQLLTLLAGNLCLPLMLEEYLLYSGDTMLVSEISEVVAGVVNAFSRWEDDDGLIEPPANFWNFVDWSFEFNPADSLSGRNSAVLNWLYVLALDAAARLADGMGEAKRAETWKKKAAGVALAIDGRFWSEERCCYVEWIDQGHPGPLVSQVSQALALLSGRAKSSRLKDLRLALTREDLLAPELFFHHFLLRAMVETGQEIQALKVIRKYWLPIVNSGSPTIWEYGVHGKGKSSFDGNGSACHGFSTTPVDFFQTVILGIRPLSDGFSRCRISPQCLDLTFAHGSIPTPSGLIKVSWKRNGSAMILSVEVPEKISAELPDGRIFSGGQTEIRLEHAAQDALNL